jgi:hypothetical protein
MSSKVSEKDRAFRSKIRMKMMSFRTKLKESIENFTHDHFLENVESMKVKKRSGLR